MNEQNNTHPNHDPEHGNKLLHRKRIIFFGACAVSFIIAFCIANAEHFVDVINRITEVIMPVIIGGIIAYLCNPILNLYEFRVFRRMKNNSLRRGLSLLLTVTTVFAALALLLALIIPELIDSVTHLVDNYEFYLDSLLSFVQSIVNKVNDAFGTTVDVSDMERLTAFIVDTFGSMENAISQALTALESLVVDTDLLGNLWTFLVDLFNTFKNAILGIIIAFYILASKEKRIAQVNKFRRAYFSEKNDRRAGEVVTLVDRTFGGFIKGLLLDALAVGVMTFLFLSIFKVSEYNLLIAVICAVTNIIPVFGPFIGAIPSGLIVLITSPEKFIIFVILILVIQQLDGNILVPLIQGNNTGVSSLAVLVSITVMGGLFGIAGMVIGVPIFAVVIELVKQAVERRLARAGAPTDTTHYYPENAVGNAEEEVHYQHSHLRYIYDHSRLKPHVDKAIESIDRFFQGKQKTEVEERDSENEDR